jgi:transposase
MYVRIKATPNSPRRSIQIVESVRVGGKVKQRIVRYVGIAMDEKEEDAMRTLAESTVIPNLIKAREKEQAQLALFAVEPQPRGRKKAKSIEDVVPVSEVKLEDIVETDRIIEGIHEVGGALFSELGFDEILKAGPSQVLKETVLARLANPQSKKKSSTLLNAQFGRDISEDRIYRMMDKLAVKIPQLQTAVRLASVKLLKEKISLLFFDVTTLYFESETDDELRKHGYSKDQKFHLTQVVLALATTAEGLPVGYELFEGNKAETKTLLDAIESWQEQGLQIDELCFVADRAMFSEANLAALDAKKIRYVVAAKLKKLPESLRASCLDDQYSPWVHNNHLVWGKELDMNHRRLIVTYSSKRHRKDLKERQSILDKIQSKLTQGTGLITNRAYRSYLTQPNAQKPILDHTKIQAAAQWDGLHGIITNDKTAKPTDLLAMYHRLWIIEDAFRLNKHNLKMRPIYHFKPDRIKAHIAICYLTFALARHLQYRVALNQTPLSFETIRDELLSVQASILTHKTTKDQYRLPSKFSQNASKIYKALGLKRSQDATIFSK